MTEEYQAKIYHKDLIVESSNNHWRIIRLNRPDTLHVLDITLVNALIDAFEDAQADQEVKAVWFDSTTSQAFCAGADLRKLRQLVLEGENEIAEAFFKQQYALNLILHCYTKPIVIWGEGYVMGGGLGLFMAAPFRLVGEYSRLAMPEIHIGLYPDVGGTKFLADRGVLGLFSGLTGSIMTSAGAYAIGWATHICKATRDSVLNKMTEIIWDKEPSRAFISIANVLTHFHRPVPAGPLQNSLDILYDVCQGNNFEEDYYAIMSLVDSPSDWLRQAGESLQKGSPRSAAITWLLWQWARTPRTWKEIFDLETQISAWKIRQSDFIEGVRARLIDKDLAPIWDKPNNLSLAGILSEKPPITNLNTWNNILRQYHVI